MIGEAQTLDPQSAQTLGSDQDTGQKVSGNVRQFKNLDQAGHKQTCKNGNGYR